MRRVTLVIRLFSILLISQSIFGCPLKHDHVERNPGLSTNDTEGSSSNSAVKDGEEKNKQRDWLSGAKFGLGVLKEVSGQLNKVERKVTISVVNKSGYKWQAINAYIKHGTADLALPYEVPKGGSLNYGARKTAGPVTFGAEGVFSYYIPGIKKTLAVMFSVPFNYAVNSNWVDVQLYEGTITANKVLWYKMYHNNPNKFKGNNMWYEKNLEADRGEKGIRAKFSMSSSGQATIQMEILPRKSSWWPFG